MTARTDPMMTYDHLSEEPKYWNPEKRARKAWEALDPTPPELPDWLKTPEPPEPKPSAESKALLFEQYEAILPRILDLISGGYTLNNALREVPFDIDQGVFYRWLKRNPKNFELYKEAKEIRTEAWAGKIIEYAEGKDADGNDTMEDVSRSKLKVDTLKWLMSADNRKVYGDTKTVDVTGGISITAALAQAQARLVENVIDAEFEDVKQIESGDDDDN